jgi:hypothetical protein
VTNPVNDQPRPSQPLFGGMDAAHPQLSPDRQLVAFDSGNAI